MAEVEIHPAANEPNYGPGSRARFERGHVKYDLIRDIASGMPPKDISVRYKMPLGTLHRFKTRHIQEILDTKAALNEELVGLWVADRKARLAELQDDIETLSEAIEKSRAANGGRPDVHLVRAKREALKQAGEEVGAYKPDATVVVPTVIFNVSGSAEAFS